MERVAVPPKSDSRALAYIVQAGKQQWPRGLLPQEATTVSRLTLGDVGFTKIVYESVLDHEQEAAEP